MFYLYLFLSFFALFGVYKLIETAFLRLLRVQNNGCSSYLVLCIKEPEKGDIKFETRLALSRLEWIKKSEFDGILISDCGLSEGNRECCRAICEQAGFELLSLPLGGVERE